MTPPPLEGSRVPTEGWPTTRDEPPFPRVLVVEDSSSARRLMQELLRQFGATPQNVRLAADSAEALRLVEEWAPNLVFLDVELHREGNGGASASPTNGGSALDGDELGAAMLRAHPKLPLVVVTAHDPDHPKVVALQQQGAIGVVVKPVLASRIQEMLALVGIRFPATGSRESVAATRPEP